MMAILRQTLACILLAVTIIAAAVPVISDTGLPLSTASPNIRGSVSPVTTVGWQSIFWGLFTLALNSMSQPSLLDGDFPQSNLLYPSRSSPIVCAADALDVLIEWTVRVLKGEGFREAALEVSWRRMRDRRESGILSLEASPVEKYPIASTLFFLGTSTQFVKIMGFQGLPWVQAAAGIYYVSYIILTAVSVASSNLRESTPLTPWNECHQTITQNNPFTRLFRLLRATCLMAHLPLYIWAVYEVVHMRIREDKDTIINAPDRHGFSEAMYWVIFLLLIFSSSCVVMLLWFTMFVTLAILPFSILKIDPRKPKDIEDMGWVFWVFTAAWECLFIFGIFHYRPVILEKSITLTLILMDYVVQGGGALILYLGVYLVGAGCLGWVCRRVPLLQGWEPKMGGVFNLVTFALTNLAVTALYYGCEYDPEGTIKPEWTEKLG